MFVLPLTSLRKIQRRLILDHVMRWLCTAKSRTWTWCAVSMMASSNGYIFRATGVDQLRGPVKSLHIGQWRGDLIFSLICSWISGWVNNNKAGDLRRHCAYYDSIVIETAAVFHWIHGTPTSVDFMLARGFQNFWQISGALSGFPLQSKGRMIQSFAASVFSVNLNKLNKHIYPFN